jgi:hypothetical protein
VVGLYLVHSPAQLFFIPGVFANAMPQIESQHAATKLTALSRASWKNIGIQEP